MGEDSDKTEEPTEHKLQEGRKKGQVFKSQDIIQTLLLLAAGGVLYVERGFIVKVLADYMRYNFNFIGDRINLQEHNLLFDWLQALIIFFMLTAPLLAAAFITAVAINLAQVKFIFTFYPMNPKLSKINPVEGFKKIFSMKSAFELAKQLIKLTVVTWVILKVINVQLISLKNAVFWDIPITVGLVRVMTMKVMAYVVTAMFAISILDFLFQKKQFLKQMKMSIKELKDEYKDTEGNPQVKGKLKQIMRQNSQERMMEDVADSAAVVTNPTHLAVALKYQPGVDKAPIVVAKGERLVAVAIKAIAEENDIPIIENVELARALYTVCDLGSSIPMELYKATAEVLAYVFRLKRKRELMKKRKYMAGRPNMAPGR